MARWQQIKIGDVCVVERGGSPRPIDKFITEDENGINWIKIGDTTESMYITQTAQKIIPEGAKKSRFVHSGDFLLSNSMSFGRPYILNIDGCIHDGWLVLRDEGNLFDKHFLYYCLSAPITYAKFKSMAVGGVVNNLNSEMVRKVEIPLPPLNEQRKIAAVLDKVSDLIAKRRQQLDKLDELVKARFVEMFGDPITNPKNWSLQSLSSICKDIYGGGTPSKSHPEYFDGNIPWVSPKDMKSDVILDSVDHITEEAVQNSSTKMVPKNAVLMVIRSGILKHTLPVAIAAVELTVNQDMKVFIAGEDITSKFLMYYFKAIEADVLSGVRGVTADNIDFKEFQKRLVIVPPIELQNQFAAFVEQTEKTKTTISKSLEKLETLKKALMQEYFGRGDLMSEYVKDASIFAQHIIVALDCLEEAHAMQSIFSQEKYESQYKIAPHFYSTAYHAMLFQCQMEIAKLFDEGGHGDPYTFDQFKNKLCKSNEIKPSYIEKYKLKKRIADKDIQAIRSRRNGYLAHSDEKYFDKPQILFNDEPVNAEAIKSLLLTMLTICNRVIFNSTEYSPAHLYSTYNGDDFVKIFDCKTWYEQDMEDYLNTKR